MQPMGISPAEISAKTEAICGIHRTRIVPGYAATNLLSRHAPATGFAISTCTEPEIRLLDESIAAGDAAVLEKPSAVCRSSSPMPAFWFLPPTPRT
jgi:hypothetical protein